MIISTLEWLILIGKIRYTQHWKDHTRVFAWARRVSKSLHRLGTEPWRDWEVSPRNTDQSWVHPRVSEVKEGTMSGRLRV